MKKEEKPKSMFEKETPEMEHESNLGAEHPEEDATGMPVHPELQTLMSKLQEPEEEPLMPHKVRGIKK